MNDSRNTTFPLYTTFCVVTACIVRYTAGYNVAAANISGSAIHNCADFDKKLDGRFPYCFDMNSWLWGFAVGNHAFGAFFGSFLGSYAQEKLGRRQAMMVNNFFLILGGILISCSINPGMWICGRGFIGFGCGFGTVVAPTYIGEISPIKTRGTYGAFNQGLTTIGMLVVESMSLGMSTPIGWRVLLSLPGAFSIVQMLLIPLCVETPRYLVSKGRVEEAKAVLLKLRNNCDVEVEFQQIVKAREEAKGSGRNLGLMEIIRDPHCRTNFLVCVGLGALQQWSGINGIMYYSTSIFRHSYGEKAKYVTLGLGGLNVFMSIISILLIDRVGRKFLLLVSSGGSAIFCVLMCIGLEINNTALTVTSILIFVAFFAVGLGPIIFLIMTELMPTNAVSVTSGTALAFNWLSNFIIGLFFPTVSRAIHGYTFLIFMGCCLAGFFGILFFVHETKCQSIEELTARDKGNIGGSNIREI
ncbi:monosaccharide transporter [Basidiobolus meristosporus CBS 931.73]|uniref:Monosaccharide transporter n=1 Tax=Basidiobolus meristosporus CBS 931.73 TaxID=1314790 RepID=A0A1Y1YNE0_9FUNG|nr:monosaccharide transporter [Basidiobolus meristosporus CBS 931.73]|eukprot:ORX99531.1 monosaccharide transporter [Basidiobolus meristosporus CBS 931.73]